MQTGFGFDAKNGNQLKLFENDNGVLRAALVVIGVGLIGVTNYAVMNYTFEVYWYSWKPWDPKGYRPLKGSWKIQPRRTIDKAAYFKAVKLSCFNMFLGGLGVGLIFVLHSMDILHTKVYNSSPLDLWFINDGYHRQEWGIVGTILESFWIIGETRVYFWLNEFMLYIYHRISHHPCLYKHMHKVHHMWTSPFPFVTLAVHPIEFIANEIINFGLIYILPFHFVGVLANAYYSSVEGLLAHTGVHITAIFPWEPTSTFHDDHHSLFHVNFGLRTTNFDKLFGTIRVHRSKDVPSMIYSENNFSPQSNIKKNQ